jgi:hypothetical protein
MYKNGFVHKGTRYGIDFEKTESEDDGYLYAVSINDYSDRVRIRPEVVEHYIKIPCDEYNNFIKEMNIIPDSEGYKEYQKWMKKLEKMIDSIKTK